MIKFPLSRFVIEGASMEPMLRNKDRVLTHNFGDIQKGSIIVFPYKGKLLIKRVKKVDRNIVVACSDNKKVAKSEYLVKKNEIIGRVFLKY